MSVLFDGTNSPVLVIGVIVVRVVAKSYLLVVSGVIKAVESLPVIEVKVVKSKRLIDSVVTEVVKSVVFTKSIGLGVAGYISCSVVLVNVVMAGEISVV